MGVPLNYFIHQADMPADAPSYVPRAADEEAFQAIQRGEFCYLLTPSQMGKSSLMIRTKLRLEREGCEVAAFSLESIGGESVAGPDQLYLGMLDKIGAHLDLEDELSDVWDANNRLSPLQRFFKALEYAARSSPKGNGSSPARSLVVMIDEIGVVRRLSFPTAELFGAIREVHSRNLIDRSATPLTFCLLGTANPSELVDDPAMTPFRLGRRIDLCDFTLAESMQLARGLTSLGIEKNTAEAALRRVHYWTNGHPRLSQRICGRLAESFSPQRKDSAAPPASIPNPAGWVDAICEEMLFTGNPIENDDGLAAVHERLLPRAGAQLADLLDLYGKIRAGRSVPDDKHDPLVSQLLLSGIVRSEKGRLISRNRIYRRAFDREWIRSNMPRAELRREREAWRRGVAWAGAIGGVVTTIIALLLSLLVVQIQRERTASAAGQFALARVTRMAARSGVFAGMPDPSARDGPRYRALNALSNAVSSYRHARELASEAAAVFSIPDLRLLSAASSNKVSSSVVDPRTGTYFDPTGNGPEPAIASGTVTRKWSSPGTEFRAVQVINSSGPELLIFHHATNQILRLSQSVPAAGLAFHPSMLLVAIINPSSGIDIFTLSATNSLLIQTLPPGPIRRPTRIQFQPDGDWLADLDTDSHELRLWDRQTDAQQLLSASSAILDFAWHPSGRSLAFATARKTIYIDIFPQPDSQDPLGAQHWKSIDTDLRKPAGMTFNHRGDMLACLDGDRRILLSMPWSGVTLSFPLHGRSFEFLRFSDDDRRLDAVCSRTGLCESWQVSGDEYSAQPTFLDPSQTSSPFFDVAPSGDRLVVGGSSELAVIDLTRRAWAGRLEVSKAASVFFHPELNNLFVASRQTGLHQLALTHAGPRGRIKGIEPPHLGWEFDPIAGLVAAPFPDRKIIVGLRDSCRVLDAATGKFERKLLTVAPYDQLLTSTNGRWLAARHSADRSLHLLDLDRRPQGFARSLDGGSSHFAFTADSSWFLFSTEDQLLAISLAGDVSKNEPRQLARSAGDEVPFAVEFSLGIIAYVEAGARVQLETLDLASKEHPTRLLTLEFPAPAPLVRLAFNPVRPQLIGLDRENTVHLWDLDRVEQQLSALGLPHMLPTRPTTRIQPD